MKSEKKHIGILGGTFDPIHNAHLRLAIDLKINTDLSKILFIPNYIPPHKDNNITDIKHRLEMLNLATNNLTDIEVDRTEIEIAEEKLLSNKTYRSYMVDTLDVLKNNYKKSNLWLILGADSFKKFDTWYKWQEILDKCNFLILNRDNQVIDESIDWLQSIKNKVHIKKKFESYNLPNNVNNGCICLMNSRMLDISATEIRNLISKDLSTKFLIPDEVNNYIRQNDLYK